MLFEPSVDTEGSLNWGVVERIFLFGRVAEVGGKKDEPVMDKLKEKQGWVEDRAEGIKVKAIRTVHEKQLKAKRGQLDEAGKFRAYALDIVGGEYAWGKETLFGADCSGTVCLPLMLLGYAIRTTADDLYRKVFTEEVGEKEKKDPSKIMAVFYLTNTPAVMKERQLPEGYARHVTPVVGEWVVIDANYRKGRVVLRSSRAVNIYFRKRVNCRAVWRGFNREKAKEISDARSEFHDIDEELTGVFK